MKNIWFLLFIFIYPATIYCQFPPNCNNLLVEDIQLGGDTSGLLFVTISNNCDSCASGLNGCVYEELRIIRTVPPFDTIAASNCFCLWSPDNNSQTTYSIYTNGSHLPPTNEFRVSLMDCDCDTIPLSPILNSVSQDVISKVQFLPNPANESLFLVTLAKMQFDLRIIDITGRIISTHVLNDGERRIDISHLPNGMYVIEAYAGAKRALKPFTYIKT